MWNFECSTVVIATPLAELSNLGLKVLAIDTGTEEVFTEGATLVSDLAFEQAPEWGIWHRQKSSSEIGEGAERKKGREHVDILLMPSFRPLAINQ